MLSYLPPPVCCWPLGAAGAKKGPLSHGQVVVAHLERGSGWSRDVGDLWIVGAIEPALTCAFGLQITPFWTVSTVR